MNILDICNNGSVLSILRVVKIIITIIKIVVPIILILSLSINYITAIKTNDTDLLSKANKSAVPKIIAAILVFLIPTFVHILGNISGENSYLHCLDIANSSSITEAYERTAKEYINKAKDTLELSDYNVALSQINKVKDDDIKKVLLDDLTSIKEYVDLGVEIKKLNQNYDADKYEELSKKVSDISNEKYKNILLKMFNESSGGGTPLNIVSSFEKYNDTKYPALNGYYLYIPKNATTNMPLVVIFPPNSLSGPTMKQIAESKSLDNFRGFIYIPTINSSSRKDWDTNASKAAVSKIQDLISEYKLDESRISLTAFSSSGYYIYWTANEYRIFSSIAPISSGMNIDTIKNYYKDWEYLKTLPMKGYGEKGGPTTESGRSCQNVGTVGWSAKTAMCGVFEGLGKCSSCTSCDNFTYLPEVCHGEIGAYVFNLDQNNNNISDILEWMISQKKK